MNHWDEAILDRTRYESALESLAVRARKRPYLLDRSLGESGVTLRYMLLHRESVASAIIRGLAGGNTDFEPHQRRTAAVGGKLRQLYSCSWPEHIVQMVIAAILSEKTDYLLAANVYSYRKGKSGTFALRCLANHIKKHREMSLVIKRDIAAYGESIQPRKLLQFISTRTDLSQSNLFFKLLANAIAIKFFDQALPGKFLELPDGLPTGSPVVVPLLNLYLVPLDEALLALGSSFYGRYGDDFLFTSDRFEIIEAALVAIKLTVNALGLRLRDEKSRDILLSITTSPRIPKVPGFSFSTGIEWLGKRIDARGIIGCKTEHDQQMRAFCRAELVALVKRTTMLDPQDRLRIVQAGWLQLLDPSHNPRFCALAYSHDRERQLRLLDQLAISTLARAIFKYWKVTKSDAWKLARTIKCSSIWYQRTRRFHKRRVRVAA